MASKGTTFRSALRRGQLLIMFACCAALCGFEAEAVPAVSETVDVRDSSEFGHLVVQESEGTKSKEIIPFKTGGRTKRWVYKGYKWSKKDLTYKIANYTSQLDEAVVDQTIAVAFAMWSDHADLTFSPGNDEVDIQIAFVHGIDGLPNASVSFQEDNIYFDDDKPWMTSDSDDGYDLLANALFGIGGTLGLYINNDTSSVMHSGVLTTLGSDDIEGIQALYGPKTATGNVRQFCADPQVDAILMSPSETRYVFKGQKYWELADDGFVIGYPKFIRDTWNGLPGDIDFAFTDEQGGTYFYKGSKVWHYDREQMMISNKHRAPAASFPFSAYVKDQKRLHSLSMRDFCLSDSIRSLLWSTRMN